jgi:hypothetical protein
MTRDAPLTADNICQGVRRRDDPVTSPGLQALEPIDDARPWPGILFVLVELIDQEGRGRQAGDQSGP